MNVIKEIKATGGKTVNTSTEIKLEAYNHFKSLLNMECIPLEGAPNFLREFPQVVSLPSNVSLTGEIS